MTCYDISSKCSISSTWLSPWHFIQIKCFSFQFHPSFWHFIQVKRFSSPFHPSFWHFIDVKCFHPSFGHFIHSLSAPSFKGDLSSKCFSSTLCHFIQVLFIQISATLSAPRVPLHPRVIFHPTAWVPSIQGRVCRPSAFHPSFCHLHNPCALHPFRPLPQPECFSSKFLPHYLHPQPECPSIQGTLSLAFHPSQVLFIAISSKFLHFTQLNCFSSPFHPSFCISSKSSAFHPHSTQAFAFHPSPVLFIPIPPSFGHFPSAPLEAVTSTSLLQLLFIHISTTLSSSTTGVPLHPRDSLTGISSKSSTFHPHFIQVKCFSSPFHHPSSAIPSKSSAFHPHSTQILLFHPRPVLFIPIPSKFCHSIQVKCFSSPFHPSSAIPSKSSAFHPHSTQVPALPQVPQVKCLPSQFRPLPDCPPWGMIPQVSDNCFSSTFCWFHNSSAPFHPSQVLFIPIPPKFLHFHKFHNSSAFHPSFGRFPTAPLEAWFHKSLTTALHPRFVPSTTRAPHFIQVKCFSSPSTQVPALPQVPQLKCFPSQSRPLPESPLEAWFHKSLTTAFHPRFVPSTTRAPHFIQVKCFSSSFHPSSSTSTSSTTQVLTIPVSATSRVPPLGHDSTSLWQLLFIHVLFHPQLECPVSSTSSAFHPHRTQVPALPQVPQLKCFPSQFRPLPKSPLEAWFHKSLTTAFHPRFVPSTTRVPHFIQVKCFSSRFHPSSCTSTSSTTQVLTIPVSATSRVPPLGHDSTNLWQLLFIHVLFHPQLECPVSSTSSAFHPHCTQVPALPQVPQVKCFPSQFRPLPKSPLEAWFHKSLTTAFHPRFVPSTTRVPHFIQVKCFSSPSTSSTSQVLFIPVSATSRVPPWGMIPQVSDSCFSSTFCSIHNSSAPHFIQVKCFSSPFHPVSATSRVPPLRASVQKSRMSIRTEMIVCGNQYDVHWKQILYLLIVSRESFELASEMGARISFMSADVATPPTSEWQALASSFASDSATLMSRLLLLFIFITIAACRLHLHMRKRSSVSDDGMFLNEKPVPWEQSKLAFVTGLIFNLT